MTGFLKSLGEQVWELKIFTDWYIYVYEASI